VGGPFLVRHRVDRIAHGAQTNAMKVLALGSRCNNACVFCTGGICAVASPGTCRFMVHEEERSSLDSIAAVDAAVPTSVLRLVGGEPTLRDDLSSLVTRARTLGVSRVELQTNARRLAYTAYAKQMAAVGVCGLLVGIHGSTAPMHDYHTNVPGSFGQTIRGTRHAVAAGVDVVLCCVVTRSNFRHLAEIVTLGTSLGACTIRLQVPPIAGQTMRLRDRVVVHPEILVEHVKEARCLGVRLGTVVLVDPRFAVSASSHDPSSDVEAQGNVGCENAVEGDASWPTSGICSL